MEKKYPGMRVNLTPKEIQALRRHSKDTGVPIARLVADAVRAQILTVPARG